ncbi:MAG: hypothetical protein C3F12_09975 [Candidatus Methylomirabilota bacterium]|nr:hypothetical protein [Candidatus Methylomirabilis sp.]NJD68428.1 hypothetical protein [candidate division NC10 bacterium]PWB46348.1 MAG: hypothetical protein C3F12_09975 [candidate division NC10 bacterium]
MRAQRALRDRALERAIEWLSERIEEQPESNRGKLIDEASKEFNLTPLQEEFLYRQFCKAA